MRPLRFWIVTFSALLMAVLTASLGYWQLQRAAYKREVQTAIARQAALPPMLVQSQQDLAGATEHRPVQLRGEWLPTHTLFLDNRPMQGRVGFFVCTPLRLDDGTVVLVQRGWVPRHFVDRTVLPLVQTPQGRVEVTGRLIAEPSRVYQLKEPPGVTGKIRQNVVLSTLSREIAAPVYRMAVLETGAASQGLLRQWPAVETGIEKHYGYAVQWFALSFLIVILYVWFQHLAPIWSRRSQRKSKSA